MIEVEHVSKYFSGRKVLDDVSFCVQEKSICGLVGRNGSGKTVLMKCICGFLLPESGQIRLRGKTLDAKHNVIGNMGIIIEVPGFLEGESARNNLLYLARLNGRIGKAEVDEALRKVGLDPVEKKRVKKYSLGMRQRLGIAQAIMEDPDIIIFDEPMNGLDEDGVRKMRKLFLELKDQGKTMIIASHNAEDIRCLCDQVYKIDHGKIRRMEA